MLDLKLMAIRYRLGMLDTESLVRLADSLLEERRETPAVIQLSILESLVMADAGPLFECACNELGVSLPDKGEAINGLLRFHIESIASGARAPFDSLRDMMQEVYYPHLGGQADKEYVGNSHRLEHLIGSYWNYEDLMQRPEVSFKGKNGKAAIPLFDEHVRQLARNWLGKAIS